jgi:hypothetical protein
MKGTKIVLAMAIVVVLGLALAGCKSDSDAIYTKSTCYEFSTNPMTIAVAETIVQTGGSGGVIVDQEELTGASATFAQNVKDLQDSGCIIDDQKEPKILWHDPYSGAGGGYYFETLHN